MYMDKAQRMDGEEQLCPLGSSNGAMTAEFFVQQLLWSRCLAAILERMTCDRPLAVAGGVGCSPYDIALAQGMCRVLTGQRVLMTWAACGVVWLVYVLCTLSCALREAFITPPSLASSRGHDGELQMAVVCRVLIVYPVCKVAVSP